LNAKGYFKTPQTVVEKMVSTLFERRSPCPSDHVLDTGCGPGDFINGVIKWCEQNQIAIPKITGIELDTGHARNAERKFKDHYEVTIEETNFLLSPERKYEYIIGNPPYVPITELTDEEKNSINPDLKPRLSASTFITYSSRNL
jgi:methylase of polypeptide subunit release factors